MREELKQIIMTAIWYSGKPTPLVFQKDLDKILDRTAKAIMDRLEIDEAHVFKIIVNNYTVLFKNCEFDRLYKLQEEGSLAKKIAKEKPIKIKTGGM